jgi:hypothetical protein
LLEALSYQKDAPVDAEEVIRNNMGQAYGAGADTVWNSFMSPSALPALCLAFLTTDRLGLDQLRTRNDSLPGGATEGSSRA